MKKNVRSIFSLLICCVIVFSIISPAYAVESSSPISTKRIDFANGNYEIVVITEEDTVCQGRTTNTKTGSKTSTYYNANNEAIYSVKVIGTFTYNGSTAKATSSTATVSLYSTAATYVSKSASYASNYATATGKVTYNGIAASKTVTLYCSASGTLS